MEVSEVLRVKGNTLYTVSPDAKLSECIVSMAENDIGSLLVMDRGNLVGMLTFREVLRVLARQQSGQGSDGQSAMAEVGVRNIMNAQPNIASPAMDVNELRRVMLEHRQRYVPVMEDGTVLGVISFHDVAKAVLEEQGFENKMLKAYIRDWPAEGSPA